MAINNKFAAYQKAQNSSLGFSDLERRVFMEAARRLDEAHKNYNPESKDHTEAREALRFNWRLWTLIQNDVGREENPLNDSLRLKLLELSAYVDQQTFKFTVNPNPEVLVIFRDILQNIAKSPEQPAHSAQEHYQGQDTIDRRHLESTATRAAPEQKSTEETPPPLHKPLGPSFTV